MGRVKLDGAGKTFNLRMETQAVLDSLKRISHAFVQYCSSPEVRSTILPIALIVSRVSNLSLWENAEGTQRLLQIVSVFRIVFEFVLQYIFVFLTHT